MCAENRVYREHRNNDVAILPPRVVPLGRGVASRFLDEITRGNVQGKFPRILDDASATLQAFASFAVMNASFLVRRRWAAWARSHP